VAPADFRKVFRYLAVAAIFKIALGLGASRWGSIPTPSAFQLNRARTSDATPKKRIDQLLLARFNDSMSSSNKKPTRLSLYGMKPEDALKKALATKPPAKPAKKPTKKG